MTIASEKKTPDFFKNRLFFFFILFDFTTFRIIYHKKHLIGEIK